ncbi:MAG: hypothetical protein ABWY11_26375, partial [Umezawaea sp.]
MSYLDKINKASAHRLGLPDRVIVIDNTESLVHNHELFQRLVSLNHVRAVICVAVGRIDQDEAAVMRQSTAIGSAGVTLWVGDEWGSRWAGGTDRPIPITQGPPGFDDLLAALQSRQVFDKVYQTVRDVPHQTASPGLDVVRPTFSADEMRVMRLASLREFVEHSTSDRAWPAPPAPARHGEPVDPRRDAVVPESSLGRSAHLLRRAVADLVSATTSVTSFTALLSGRPRVDLEPTAAALEAHLARVDEMLTLLDRHTSGLDGAGPTTRIGVPEVDPSDNQALSASLRDLVRLELAQGRSLNDLSTHLRRMANQCASGKGEAVRAELGAVRARSPQEVPPPALWPVPSLLLAVGAAVTGGLVAWAASSIVPGVVLSLLWAVMTALFALRLPGRASTRPRWPDWTLITVVVALGAGGTAAATRLPRPGFPAIWISPIILVSVVGLFVAVDRLWHHAAAGWVDRVRPDLIRQSITKVDTLVGDAVRDHVRSMRHRNRLSDAALLLASGADDLSRFYAERAMSGGPPEPIPHHGATAALMAVLRSDLVDLSTR